MAFEYYDKCSLLLPMDGINNGVVFTDWSPNQKTVTRFSDAKTSNVQSQYYGSSGYFNGTNGYLTVAHNTDQNFNDRDFTICLWAYWDGGAFSDWPVLIQKRESPTINSQFSLLVDTANNDVITLVVSSTGTGATTILRGPVTPKKTWFHVSVVRSGAQLSLYLNGVIVANENIGSVSLFASTMPLRIARREESTVYWNGYLQDVMIINGAALWTANFTPPARLIGELSNANAATPIEDETGTPSSRTVIAVPRTYPTKAFGAVSDANGAFTLRAPATECSIIALHEGATIKNDLIVRAMPL